MDIWVRCKSCSIKQVSKNGSAYIYCCPSCGGKIDICVSSSAPDWWSDHRLSEVFSSTPNAPQAALPAEITASQASHSKYAEGWNDCRAAMLSAAPKPPMAASDCKAQRDEEVFATLNALADCFATVCENVGWLVSDFPVLVRAISLLKSVQETKL